jgi:hypothetical protein
MIGAAAFVAAGAWLFTMDDRTIGRYRDPVYVHGVGLVAIIFFGLGGIIGARKLFDRRPGLQFTEAGIVDNASGVAAGFVLWSDITGTMIYTIKRSRFLVVKVMGPEKYIAIGGVLRRSLNRMTFKTFGSPIALSSNALAISFDELVRLFDFYLSKYGGDPSRRRHDGC